MAARPDRVRNPTTKLSAKLNLEYDKILPYHAFSSAGITISKHCNRLKGDIIEALQCLKIIYRNDLLFREVVGTMDLEREMEETELYVPGEDDNDWEDVDDGEGFSWDQLIVDIDED